MRTLLDGLEYYKVRHKRDRPFPLRPEGSHPRIVETEAMMRPKLNSIHDHRVERGCARDPTPLEILQRQELCEEGVMGLGENRQAIGD